MEQNTLRAALETLRAADELRRALPPGSRDRLLVEADIAILDREIHDWAATAGPDARRLSRLEIAISRVRRRVDGSANG